MDKNIEINVNVNADRKISIDLPKDFPCVPVTVIVTSLKRGKAKLGKKSKPKIRSIAERKSK